jgi:hypothetical protein
LLALLRADPRCDRKVGVGFDCAAYRTEPTRHKIGARAVRNARPFSFVRRPFPYPKRREKSKPNDCLVVKAHIVRLVNTTFFPLVFVNAGYTFIVNLILFVTAPVCVQLSPQTFHWSATRISAGRMTRSQPF